MVGFDNLDIQCAAWGEEILEGFPSSPHAFIQNMVQDGVVLMNVTATEDMLTIKRVCKYW